MKASPSIWAGRVFSGLFVLFMIFDIGVKLVNLPVVDETMARLGWTAGYGPMIGAIELVALILYLVPRTSLAGAVLMTGLFGGAMATHTRVNDPLFSHTLFSIYLSLFMWGGLWLRDERLRGLFPWRRAA